MAGLCSQPSLSIAATSNQPVDSPRGRDADANATTRLAGIHDRSKQRLLHKLPFGAEQTRFWRRYARPP